MPRADQKQLFDEQVFLDAWKLNEDDNRTILDLCCLPGTVTSSLSEGLSRLSLAMLKEFADDLALTTLKSSRKERFVEDLREAIIDLFDQLVSSLPLSNLKFLRYFGSKSRLLIPKSALEYSSISHSHNLGFLMLFEEGEDYVLTFPRELSERFLTKDYLQMERKAALRQQLAGYAMALTNLYGILDIDQFAIIWNRYQPEMLTPAEIGDELALLSLSWYFFWYEDEYAISSYFEDFDEVEAFLPTIRDVPYYTPTREELLYYFNDPFDESTPEVEALRSFLASYSYGDDFESLIADLTDLCIVGMGIHEAYALLKEYGILFDGSDESRRFSQLYAELDKRSRKWVFRGHTRFGKSSINL